MDGLIVLDDGITTYNCTILDTSLSGAQIRLEEDCRLPERFVLISVRACKAYEAIKMWDKALLAGLRFERNLDLNPLLPQEFIHLYQYWLDCAANEASGS